jgi:hypothetical protein
VGDAWALLAWTVAIVAFFWDAVTFRGALFYFDITEINYAYRAFFAEELKAGRFSRWCPGLYCGLPLFSESQAGYLHPFKYLFYPWLATWQAFNLDCVFSVWMTGLGTYLWLRRHVGPAGALTGAAIFGASGYVFGHFIHTSMLNAIASLPFVVLGLEWSWSSGHWRGVVVGAFALAFQVFAGHLQDSLLTILLVGLYGLYRALTEPKRHARVKTMAMAIALGSLGVLLSAVQWVPSKELLDRSPRAGGLSRGDLTYGSWHPELLPTLAVREAYGTRARDTDWMDGFYPYHEMNAYVGLIAIALAVVGAGGRSARDRWCGFWVILVGLGVILMLGKFTFLFDFAHRVPILGSSREPVRFHVWVSLAVAALAAVGVERIGNLGGVSLRPGMVLAGVIVAVSIPILIYVYYPVWSEPTRWTGQNHLARFRWLGRELVVSIARTAVLSALAYVVARAAVGIGDDFRRRSKLAAILPILVICDLLGAHLFDVPTITPAYWTVPPESAIRLKDDPSLIRIFGMADKSSGEPGYASEPDAIDFLAVRDPLDWSLPLVWHVATSRGETPMISRRFLDYTDHAVMGRGRLDIEGVSHVLTGKRLRGKVLAGRGVPAGQAFIQGNPRVLPRARLAGQPVYADDRISAIAAVDRLSAQDELRTHLVVEDPSRPLPVDAEVSGTCRIVEEVPERVVVEVDAAAPAYLVLSDTYDPGWTATVDGVAAAIRPAYVAFRAVYVDAGKHRVVFAYRPAGFDLGLALSTLGLLVALAFWFLPSGGISFEPEHARLTWPPRWRAWFFGGLAGIVLCSVATVGPNGRPTWQLRWTDGSHRFTWGAGFEAMRTNRKATTGPAR